MRTARYREQVKTGASVETLREITNIDTIVKKSLKQQLRLPSTHRRRIATESSQPPSLPLPGYKVLEHYNQFLSKYECQEILSYSLVHYIGKVHKQNFEGQDGDYNYVLHDQVHYRFELLEMLGKGSFGQAFKVFDHKSKQLCCLKIIKGQRKLQSQALVEIKILEHLKGKPYIVNIQEYFTFRGRICLVFELLSYNLYQLTVQNYYRPFSLNMIRRYAYQILEGLNILQNLGIIHADLKPENILICQGNKLACKIIDFGSSCYIDEKIYSYIQSRYYRAPEIMLGVPYDHAIDMWSLGCILAEMCIGQPLWPGSSEVEQMQMIVEILGLPSDSYLEKCSRKKKFFVLNPTRIKQYASYYGIDDLRIILRQDDPELLDFIKKIFVYEGRITAKQALEHPFIKQPKAFKSRSLTTRNQERKSFQFQFQIQ